MTSCCRSAYTTMSILHIMIHLFMAPIRNMYTQLCDRNRAKIPPTLFKTLSPNFRSSDMIIIDGQPGDFVEFGFYCKTYNSMTQEIVLSMYTISARLCNIELKFAVRSKQTVFFLTRLAANAHDDPENQSEPKMVNLKLRPISADIPENLKFEYRSEGQFQHFVSPQINTVLMSIKVLF